MRIGSEVVAYVDAGHVLVETALVISQRRVRGTHIFPGIEQFEAVDGSDGKRAGINGSPDAPQHVETTKTVVPIATADKFP